LSSKIFSWRFSRYQDNDVILYLERTNVRPVSPSEAVTQHREQNRQQRAERSSGHRCPVSPPEAVEDDFDLIATSRSIHR
jgi:hypothetical protein